MPDFHVATLRYRVKPCEDVEFVNPPALERETPLFRMKLESGALAFELRTHFETVAEARAELEPFLRTWEISQYIHFGQKRIEIVFEKADIVDLNPPPDGSQFIFPEAAVCTSSVGDVRVIVVVTEYPPPILPFEARPLVELLWNKYKDFLEGRWPLLAMGYFCLSALESYEAPARGKRQHAATKYNIDKEVLDTLGKLTSEHGDEATARKLPSKHPLSPREQEWIDAVIRCLIRRAGEVSASSVTSRIALADFPVL